jgi:hypothetical protein
MYIMPLPNVLNKKEETAAPACSMIPMVFQNDRI